MSHYQSLLAVIVNHDISFEERWPRILLLSLYVMRLSLYLQCVHAASPPPYHSNIRLSLSLSTTTSDGLLQADGSGLQMSLKSPSANDHVSSANRKQLAMNFPEMGFTDAPLTADSNGSVRRRHSRQQKPPSEDERTRPCGGGTERRRRV
ncbi:hypothetical protein EYF80_028281 [Liparis tanakae]|uniref:Uncharacterized protein n=1 Tax=Liparis tanakae TaxID=230148 RepID=A0A4Z2H705_9TELE|nr:hypothetical protein EYF80_028281 [Liparis tanakae]